MSKLIICIFALFCFAFVVAERPSGNKIKIALPVHTAAKTNGSRVIPSGFSKVPPPSKKQLTMLQHQQNFRKLRVAPRTKTSSGGFDNNMPGVGGPSDKQKLNNKPRKIEPVNQVAKGREWILLYSKDHSSVLPATNDEKDSETWRQLVAKFPTVSYRQRFQMNRGGK